MQPITASPRDSLTEAQVVALIDGLSVQVDAGLEILDEDGTLVEDFTEHLISDESSVSWETGRIHRRCSLRMVADFGFGSRRMRPYMTLTAGGVSARFDLGDYVPVMVARDYDVAVGETYTVVGVDKLVLLDTAIGSAYTVNSADVIVDEVEALIGLIDPDTAPTFAADGDQGSTTPAADRVWEASNANTYLAVANALLATIGYEGLWVDFAGDYRTQQYRVESERPSEWTYDFTADSTASADRSEESDWWEAPNRWIFVRDRPTVGVADTATDGSGGRYEVSNTADGATSSGARGGIVRRSILRVDAADATGLTEQADAIVAAQKRVITVRKITVEPNPLHGHDDIVTLTDDVFGSGKGIVRSWTLPLDGGQMALTVEML